MSTKRNNKKGKFDRYQYNNIQQKNHWDKKSIIITSCFGIILIFFILSINGIIPFNKLFSNKSNPNFNTAIATVYSIESKEMYEQTKLANTNTIIGYNIKYSYKIKGVLFENEELISSIAAPKFRLFITQHLNQEVFYIRYEIANPKNSSLIEDIN